MEKRVETFSQAFIGGAKNLVFSMQAVLQNTPPLSPKRTGTSATIRIAVSTSLGQRNKLPAGGTPCCRCILTKSKA